MMPVAGHPPPAHEAKAKAARQKEISVIFFIRSLGRVQQQIGMNRQSRRRAERAVAAAGRAPPENSQPKANRSRKPSEDGDSRKQVQSASGNRRGTGTAKNRSNPRPETVGERGQPKTGATRVRKPSGNGDSRKPKPPTGHDRPRRAAIRGGFAARSRDSPKQGQPEAGTARSRSMKKAVQPGLCRGRTAPVGL